HVVGQIQSMNNAFWDLGVGLLFAAVFVYLLMVVNYQNFGDPFVVILALPATLCGILTMLFIIGDRVKEGQLLVEIVAPELDHQIAQAEPTLGQLRGNVTSTVASLACTVATRTRGTKSRCCWDVTSA